MEVASPLTFVPPTGTKRSLACSPQLVDPSSMSLADMDVGDDNLRSSKRRRFHTDAMVDSLSEDFSAHNIFFKNVMSPSKSIFANQGAHSLKRVRQESQNPVNEDLKRVVKEQAAVIETLKAEKTDLESTVGSLKTENERVVKENQILRRAVTIQQDRQNNAENHLKEAHKHREEANERIRGLEQMILSLRYHLQAQQSHANDFMHQRPPDVF